MNFNLVKHLDTVLGWPLCVICGVWAEFNKLLFKKSPMPNKPHKIIILKWFGLGTIVKLSPLLYAIRKRFPQARLIYFTLQGNCKLPELLDCCDEIRTVRTQNLIYFVIDNLRQLLKFGLRGGDIVIDLEFFSKLSTLFSFLSGSPIRIGFYLPFFWKRSLMTHYVNLSDRKSLADVYRSLGRIIGVEIDNFSFQKVNIAAAKRQQVQNILKENGWQGLEYLIGINVNASFILLLRKWPAENFIHLIETLIKKIDIQRWKIILIGSASEREYTDSISSALSDKAKGNVINLAGKMDLEQSIALIDMLKFMISNDSGPLYLAAMQGIPTISVWGPTAPNFEFAIKAKEHIFCCLNMSCSPCFDYRQAGLACHGQVPCLRNLKPDMVIDYALNLIHDIA